MVADAAAALSPEADGGLLLPDPQGPVRVEHGPDEPVVLAGGSFVLPVAGPPGTQLELPVGDEVTEAVVPEEGVAQVRVDTEDLDDGDEVRVSLLAITPAGQGYGGGLDRRRPYGAAVAQRQHALGIARLRRRRLGADGAGR